MERIKKISWMLLVLSILIGLVSYGIQFVNFNDHKESIISHIEKETGFSAAIDGDIVLQALPFAISMKDFTLHDSGKNLVLSAKKINLKINPLLLFSGFYNAIDMKTMIVSDGVINVSHLKPSIKTDDVVLSSLILERCKLTSDTIKSLLMFDDINATIKYGSAIGNDDLVITSNLLIAGQRFDVNANFANIDESGNAENSSFSISNSGIIIKFNGSLKNLFASPELKGDITSEISSPENFNQFVKDNKILEQFFRNNQMNFSSKLLVQSNKIMIDNISMNSKDLQNLSGNLSVDLNSGLEISSEIDIDSIDVDGIYSGSDKPIFKAIESYLVSLMNEFEFHVPDDISGMFTIRIKDIKLNDQLINNTCLSADIFEGELLINEISAQLPYSGKVYIDGKITRNEVRASLNSSVFINLPDFSNIAKWLLIEDESLVVMKQFVSKFDIDLIPHHISIKNIRTSLGETQFVGRASAYDDNDGKLSCDLSLRFRKMDLDFLKIDKAYNEWIYNLFKADFDKTGTTFSELTKDLRWLRTWKMPLRLDISADELIFNNESFANAYASIGLFQNNLSVRQFTLNDAGISLKSNFELTVPVFRPYLKGNVEFGYLDTKKISKLLPDFSKYKSRYKDYLSSSFAASEPKDSAEEQFRETQIETSNYDLNFLSATSYDADLKVNIQRMKSENNYLKSLSFDASLLNGVIKVTKIASNLLYGSLQANLVVSILTAVPYFNASFTVMNANPNMLLQYASGVDKGLDGYLNASGSIATKGAMISSLYASLNGQISAVSKRFIYNGFDFGKVIDYVQSSVDAAEKMKSIRYYMTYGESMFNTIRSSIKIVDGTAETSDMVFESDRVSGALAARCVISSKMCAASSRFAFIPVGQNNPIFISMQSKGHITKLQTDVDYESIQKYILNMVKSSGDNQSSNTVESILRTRRGGA